MDAGVGVRRSAVGRSRRGGKGSQRLAQTGRDGRRQRWFPSTALRAGYRSRHSTGSRCRAGLRDENAERLRLGQALGLGSRMHFAPTGAPLTFENGQMERMQEAHLGEIFHQPETCMTKVGFHLGQ